MSGKMSMGTRTESCHWRHPVRVRVRPRAIGGICDGAGIRWDDGVEHIRSKHNEEPLTDELCPFSIIADRLVFENCMQEVQVFAVSVHDDLQSEIR